ncbi:MAG TPA: Type 1 glutamine amidotransferase-like domain-containing protein [Thermoanaerobaculia bacterium]|nr:Type 1 glutamine amidotransferase-like domain-containing protein [Thermoanaerobaculia bacterium]
MKPTLTIPAISWHGLLILVGGGEFSFGETREIDELAVARMPSDRRSIAFLPTGSGSTEYAVHLGAYFKAIDSSIEVRNVPIYRPRDARREKNLAMLRDAGMIYIGGGVTNQIIEALRGSPAHQTIRTFLDEGGLVVAIGAGASTLGTWVNDMRRAGGAIEGLDMIPASVIDTLFDRENDARLRRLASIPEVRFALGIPRSTAVVIPPDGAAQIAGDGEVAAIRKTPGRAGVPRPPL